MTPIENMYRIGRNPAYSDTHRDLAARAITRAGSAGTWHADWSTCRSCGFAAHNPEDLINGQCPRWAAEQPDQCEDCGQFADTRCDNCGLPFCSDCSTDRSGVTLCLAECQSQLHPIR